MVVFRRNVLHRFMNVNNGPVLVVVCLGRFGSNLLEEVLCWG